MSSDSRIRHPSTGPVGLAEAAPHQVQLYRAGAAVSDHIKVKASPACFAISRHQQDEEQEEWIVLPTTTVQHSRDNASGVAVILEPAVIGSERHPTHDPVHRLR